MRLGEWTNINVGEKEPSEIFTGKWKEEGKSIEVVGKSTEGPDYYQIVSYKPELGLFIEDFTFYDEAKLIRHSSWNRESKTLESKAISYKGLPQEVKATLYMRKTGINEISCKYEVVSNGRIIHSSNKIATRSFAELKAEGK